MPGVVVDRRTYRERYEALIHKIGVPFWPDAGWKDVVFALLVGSIVLVLSIWLGPPALGAKADPTVLQADPRPDWYFLWYFALLALIPPAIENVFIIGFPLVLACMFMLLPFVAPVGERSPRRRPWAVGFVAVVGVSIGALVSIGSQAPWSPVLGDVTLPAPVDARLEPDAAGGRAALRAERLHQLPHGGRRGRRARPEPDHDWPAVVEQRVDVAHPERRSQHAGVRRHADATADVGAGGVSLDAALSDTAMARRYEL